MQKLDDELLVLLTEPDDRIRAACIYPKAYPRLEAALTEVCRVFLASDSDKRKAVQDKLRGPEIGWYILHFVAEKVKGNRGPFRCRRALDWIGCRSLRR